MKNQELSKFDKEGALSETLVDEFSEQTALVLKELGVLKQDVLRFRLSLEAAMSEWLPSLRGRCCRFSVRRKFGRVTVAITAEGPECDPLQKDEAEFGDLPNSSILQTLGLSIGYGYKSGVNRITIMPNSTANHGVLRILAALALGVALGLLLRNLCPAQADAIYASAVDPVFETLMDLLRTIAGPLIFLSVLSGIYGIGDLSALGKIGKKLNIRFILMIYAVLILTLAFLLPFTPVALDGYVSGAGLAGSLLSMILDIIPTDIISPFLNGNTLQLLFLSAALGIGMLIIRDRVTDLGRLVDQAYGVLQLLMESIGKAMPVVVFVSSLAFILSGSFVDVQGLLQPMLTIVGVEAVFIGLHAARICGKLKVRLPVLLQKLLPTFLMALATASSSAAFSVNMDTCEKKLGIASNVTRFGVPLGQVIYMPMAAVEDLTFAVTLAHAFGVTITPAWLITAILISGIFAVAAPPIPGGSLSVFTMLFAQLGIPTEALALAISLDLIMDYVITAGDLTCLQEELILTADSLGYLDREKLRGES